jgi:hypothetical protein
MPKKPDADDIRNFLENLPAQLNLDPPRRWWPKYAFRSDHVENAARILESGFLLPRAAAEAAGQIVVDAASQAHIATVALADRGLVRLYFRPRTPTQWCNEGIRPRPCIEHGAHMPVPVYLLFDSRELLTEEGVMFTLGRLVPWAARGGTSRFLRSLDFMEIYHDSGVGGLGHAGRSDILNARHSEVLVPNRLPLDHLSYVVCRSAPERDTLLNLLSTATKTRWEKRVVLEGAKRIFVKRGTYVESVTLSSSASRFSFSTQTYGPHWRGPFALEVRWTGPAGFRHSVADNNFSATPDPLALQLSPPQEEYEVRLTLDGYLVYLDRYERSIAPSVF